MTNRKTAEFDLNLIRTSEENEAQESCEVDLGEVQWAPSKLSGEEDATRILKPGQGARFLLRICRKRMTGVLRFRATHGEATFVYQQGVIVGASDELEENRIRSLLLARGRVDHENLVAVELRMQSHGERFLEACIAIGVIDAGVAIDELRHQVWHRVKRGALYPECEVSFVRDESLAAGRFTAEVDALDACLQSLVFFDDPEVLATFYYENRSKRVIPTQDIDAAVNVLENVKPGTLLGGSFRNAPMTLEGYCRAHGLASIRDMWALWHVGAWRSDEKSTYSIPTPKGGRVSDVQVVSVELKQAQAFLISSRGRTFYDVLDLGSGATEAEIEEAIERVDNKYASHDDNGTEILDKPTAYAIRLFLSHARNALLDPMARASYDASIAPRESLAEVKRLNTKELDEEMDFLRGRLGFEKKSFAQAEKCFQKVLSARADHHEAAAYLAMSQLYLHKMSPAEAVGKIAQLHTAEPTSLRPLIFLSEAYGLTGQRTMEQAILRKALGLDPTSEEVLRRIRALLPKSDSKDVSLHKKIFGLHRQDLAADIGRSED